ncbi:LOW QUALITY PROTEIN: hypothetical protein V2J09_008549 [Rumex salicifolius]
MGFAVRETGDRLFVFQFFSKEDKAKVWNCRSWTFDDAFIVLKEINGLECPSDLSFTHTPIWVHSLNVPLSLRDAATVKTLGDRIGEFMEFSKKDGFDIYRGEVSGGGEPAMVGGLPLLCFHYGRVGHVVKACMYVSYADASSSPNQFGPWMRAKYEPGFRMSKEERDYEIVRLQEIFDSISVSEKLAENRTDLVEAIFEILAAGFVLKMDGKIVMPTLLKSELGKRKAPDVISRRLFNQFSRVFPTVLMTHCLILLLKDKGSSFPNASHLELAGCMLCFYQKFWGVVGPDIVSFIQQWWSGQFALDDINHTIVALIPKNSEPKYIAEFRPISLCNVLYKIGSKFMANRMKSILPSVISPSQSAFVSNRLITDNTLAALEGFNYMKHKCTGRKGTIAIKLDISNDKVEWSFLKSFMIRLGFGAAWTDRVMQLVESAIFSF